MRTLNNDMEYLNWFINGMLSDSREINVGCLRRFAECRGYGDVLYSCIFAQEDDDICPKGKVAIVEWESEASEEIRTLALYDPAFFCKHLEAACEKTAQKYPEDREPMEQSLAKIRHDLNLD